MRSTLRTVCPSCCGDGFFVSDGGPGYFAERVGSFLPSETLIRCDTCDGEGEIEACPECLQPLRLDRERGLEVCACATEALPRAA